MFLSQASTHAQAIAQLDAQALAKTKSHAQADAQAAAFAQAARRDDREEPLRSASRQTCGTTPTGAPPRTPAVPPSPALVENPPRNESGGTATMRAIARRAPSPTDHRRRRGTCPVLQTGDSSPFVPGHFAAGGNLPKTGSATAELLPFLGPSRSLPCDSCGEPRHSRPGPAQPNPRYSRPCME